jgi:hypothetical protein
MRRTNLWSISACIFCSLASAHVAMADILVVSPGPETSIEGDSNNAFPFNVDSFSMRYQQVYTSSDFSATTGPSLVTAILFRPDATFGSAFSSTLPDVEISLSTTSKTPSTLDSVFAANVGAGNTFVYNGSLSLSSAFTGPSMGPKLFDIVINLSTPFLYNPSVGDLLLDVTNFGGGVTTQFDAVSSGDTHVNRVWALSSGATSGSVDATSAGLVTEFKLTPVPEPSAFLLLGTCIALSAGAVRRLRR